MNDLLFLAHRIPYPPDKGEKIRAWNMLRVLARHYRVHLGCLIDDAADEAHLGALREVCADVYAARLHPGVARVRAGMAAFGGRSLSEGYFQDRGLQRWVRARLRDGVERAFVYCSAMAPYLAGAGAAARVLDMVDVDSIKWADYARASAGPARLLFRHEAAALARLEARAAATFGRTLLVTEAEAACLRALAPAAAPRISALPNGVDLEAFSPGFVAPPPFGTDRPVLVFTGTMDYRPNIDAMVWFVAEVMPLLREQGVRVLLCIVGAKPAAAVQALAGTDVMVTGRVADVRPYLAHAAAVVAPLRIARGIQNKVLEGMAMGRPVIASPDAATGVSAAPGRDLLVADGAEAMASAVASVLAGAHPGMGAAARAAMQAHHDWNQVLAPLPAMLEL